MEFSEFEKIETDRAVERLKNRYIDDLKTVVKNLFPEGNDCVICFGKGYTSWDTIKRNFIICDCVNNRMAKLILERQKRQN